MTDLRSVEADTWGGRFTAYDASAYAARRRSRSRPLSPKPAAFFYKQGSIPLPLANHLNARAAFTAFPTFNTKGYWHNKNGFQCPSGIHAPDESLFS